MKHQKKQLKTRISMILMLVMFFSAINYGKNKEDKEKYQKTKGDCVITYNFLEDDPKSLLSGNYEVGYRKNVIFVVKDVNPFLFKVTIDGKSLDYFSDMPQEFSLKPIKEEKGTESTENKPPEISGFDPKNFLSKPLNDQKRIAVEYQMVSPDDSKKMNSEEWKQKINEIIKNSTERNETEYPKAVTEFKESYKKLHCITKFHNSLRMILLRNKTVDELRKDVKSLIDSKCKKEALEVDDVIGEFNGWLEEANRKYEAIDFEELENKESDDTKFRNLSKQLDVSRQNLDKMKNDNIIGNIANMLNKLDEKNFERLLIVPTVDRDELHFTVKIEPIDEKNTSVPREIIEPVIVRVKGGWAINFSTGLLTRIDFDAHQYILESNENDANKLIIAEKKRTSLSPSVAALMHVYPRWSGSHGWGGFSFGIGTKDTSRLTYYFGTSYMFGVKQRFVINAGVALTEVEVLKPEYEVGQMLEQTNDLKAENLVQNEFRFRFFVGISYNLTKKTK